MKGIIIDYKNDNRELLRIAIENYTCGLEIIGEADSVKSAIKLIESLKPDVLFLDIELPDGNGFDILDNLEDNYKVVFVTSNMDYTIKAIRYSAIDYLMRPLNIDDLVATIGRLKSISLHSSQNMDFLHKGIILDDTLEDKIMVASNSGFTLLEIDKIIAVEADDNYVFFMLEDGRKHLAAHSLGYYEDLLPSNKFYRIHKSHIVNFTKVKSVEAGRTGKAILNNGTKLDIAARRKTAFVSFLKKYAKRQVLDLDVDFDHKDRKGGARFTKLDG